MTARAVALLLLIAAGPAVAVAQNRVGVHAGAVLGSSLVRDSITEPLSIRPAPGAGVAFSLDTRLNPHYRLEVRLATTWGQLVEHTPGEQRDVVSLTLWHPSITLHRVLAVGVSLRASAGALLYRPARTTGTLFDAGQPLLPVMGAGASLERPLDQRLSLVLDLSWDVHRFTTPSLRNNGFVGERPVHRVGLFAGVRRTL